MPVNYYQEDCEASNSSSGEDSQASDAVVLSPRNKNDTIALTKKDEINASGEGFLSVPSQDNSESRRVFPFLQTPSGNLKVGPNQVVFESKKVSVLVADPKHTKVNVRAEIDNKTFIAGSQDECIPITFGSDKLSHKHTDGEINELMTINEHASLKNIDNYIEGYIPSQLQKEYSLQSEIEVFMSAVRWLMHDWERRKLYLCDIMKCIRFGWIAPWQLVDIRRNPENPEFMRVTSQPDVQQLIEDGLSYAIIKYWYGNQTQDYYHWIDLLGLQEPSQRNWIDEEKNYITYREFLNDLEIYQQAGTLDSMQLRSQQLNIKADVFPPPPTVAEFMAQRVSNKDKFGKRSCNRQKGLILATISAAATAAAADDDDDDDIKVLQ
ncbi:Beta-scruin [Gryllus bimaculatus]|nr:Beta-scruin [Gryllus bimaculatus]